MAKSKIFSFVILGTALIGALYLSFSLLNTATTKDQSGLFQANTQVGGAFNLITDDKNPVTDQDFADKPKAIFFGFTNCPEICPTSLYEMGSYIDALGKKADNIHFIFISVDPERDTPEFLKTYVDSFSDKIIGLTGTIENIANAAKAYRVYYKKVPLENDYTIDHTASVFLMNKDNQLVGTIAYGEESAIAMQKLERLATQ